MQHQPSNCISESGTVLPRQITYFEGHIQDDRDLPGELLMQWRSSVDGVFGDTNADENEIRWRNGLPDILLEITLFN